MLHLSSYRIPLDKESVAAADRSRLLPFERKVLAFLDQWFDDSAEMRVFTSGTTGKPKEMVFAKEQFISSAMATIKFLGLREGERALLSLSPDYIAGKMMIVRSILGKLELYVRTPGANPLLAAGQSFDFVALVPLQVYEAVRNPQSFENLKKIRNLIIGGGNLEGATERVLSGLDQAVFHTYGMTETLSHVAMRSLAPRLEKYYQALPGISFRQDKRGCLVVNAPSLLKEPIVTNDVVELRDAYSFRYLGRYDNVINSGGVKLFPEEIEKKLEALILFPYYISAEKDERLGQKVVLKIEHVKPLPGLETKMKQVLGKYEYPKKIYYCSRFARTLSGKVVRE